MGQSRSFSNQKSSNADDQSFSKNSNHANPSASHLSYASYNANKGYSAESNQQHNQHNHSSQYNMLNSQNRAQAHNQNSQFSQQQQQQHQAQAQLVYNQAHNAHMQEAQSHGFDVNNAQIQNAAHNYAQAEAQAHYNSLRQQSQNQQHNAHNQQHNAFASHQHNAFAANQQHNAHQSSQQHGNVHFIAEEAANAAVQKYMNHSQSESASLRQQLHQINGTQQQFIEELRRIAESENEEQGFAQEQDDEYKIYALSTQSVLYDENSDADQSLSNAEALFLRAQKNGLVLQFLQDLIEAKKNDDPSESYTAFLYNAGLQETLRLLVDEAAQFAIKSASGKTNKEEVVLEAADILFSLVVALVQQGIPFSKVTSEVLQRMIDSEYQSDFLIKFANGQVAGEEMMLEYVENKLDEANLHSRHLSSQHNAHSNHSAHLQHQQSASKAAPKAKASKAKSASKAKAAPKAKASKAKSASKAKAAPKAKASKAKSASKAKAAKANANAASAQQ